MPEDGYPAVQQPVVQQPAGVPHRGWSSAIGSADCAPQEQPLVPLLAVFQESDRA